MELAVLAADQAAEQEAAGGTRNQHVAVERAAELLGIQPLAPDLVAGAIVADAGRYGHRDLAGCGPRRDDQRLFPWGAGAVGAEHRHDRQFAALGMVDQVGGIHARAAAMRLSQPTETVRVPVSSRPMVCGVVGGHAGPGDIVQSHAARAANLP